jgi:sec-independent protein translocase protein TatA
LTAPFTSGDHQDADVECGAGESSAGAATPWRAGHVGARTPPNWMGTEMFDGLFSGWHWVILLLAFLVVFGAGRLPGAAKSLGSSMHIFKKSLKEGMNDGEGPAVTQGTVLPAAELSGSSSDAARQAQIDDLQRQVQDLQRASAGGDARPASGAASAEPSRDARS